MYYKIGHFKNKQVKKYEIEKWLQKEILGSAGLWEEKYQGFFFELLRHIFLFSLTSKRLWSTNCFKKMADIYVDHLIFYCLVILFYFYLFWSVALQKLFYYFDSFSINLTSCFVKTSKVLLYIIRNCDLFDLKNT